jgi:hypothetical protein
LIKFPWTRATIGFVHSLNLSPDQWVPVDYPAPITIQFNSFSQTLEHLENFLKLMSGETFHDIEVLPDIGWLPDGLYTGWAHFEGGLNLYIKWLEAITQQCNIQYRPLEYSRVAEYWNRIGKKINLIETLYREVFYSCSDLQDYNLMPIETPWNSYSFQETMEHIGLFVAMINGENLEGDTVDNLIDTGFLNRIVDLLDVPIFNVDTQSIKYEADEILDLYTSYLENVFNQCQRTMSLVQNAQSKFLERRF